MNTGGEDVCEVIGCRIGTGKGNTRRTKYTCTAVLFIAYMDLQLVRRV